MPSPPREPLLSEQDYGAIEAAVMETARGRWFLAEFARRNRHADTAIVLEAIGRLDVAMQAGSIAAAKVAGAGRGTAGAAMDLDAIMAASEAALGDIALATETVQEVA